MFWNSYKIRFYRQVDDMDCGIACLKMIASYYGIPTTYLEVNYNSLYNKGVLTIGLLRDMASRLGFKTIVVKSTVEKIERIKRDPFIVLLDSNHYVVVLKISKRKVTIADPTSKIIKIPKDVFLRRWISRDMFGIAIVFIDFDKSLISKDNSSLKIPFSNRYDFLIRYFKSYYKQILIVVLGLVIVSILHLVSPFLEQILFDKGVVLRDIELVIIIVFAQFVLIICILIVETLRSWIVIHMTNRIGISMLDDFFKKIFVLPMKFFYTFNTGDIFKRIEDHKRVDSFYAGQGLNTIFSILTLSIFSIVLFLYSEKIFLVFALSSLTYIGFTFVFVAKRKRIDQEKFVLATKDHNVKQQLIEGIVDIKVYGSEDFFRSLWRSNQEKLFFNTLKSSALSYIYRFGFTLIKETKNLIISVISAYSVINGELTLGMMIAVQFIIAQLNSPLDQLISAIQSLQDATFSVDRILTVRNLRDENDDIFNDVEFPCSEDLILHNVSYAYAEKLILNEISVKFKRGHIIAVVGSSGSGKSTLLKIISGLLDPLTGVVKIGDVLLSNYSKMHWRSKFGIVFQNSYLFQTSIAENIAMCKENINYQRLKDAAALVNLDEFVKQLPDGFDTIVGGSNIGVSQGQMQRIIIARLIYKNPEFILLDEATSSLDSKNEVRIIDNIFSYFRNKTIIIVSHRLETIKSADTILFMSQGNIVESGTHISLMQNRGAYYEMVTSQNSY